MKMEYRNMMEQVSLSEPARADILEQLEQKSPAKRRIRPLRTALIAACVCLVLVGGAFAAASMVDRGEASDYMGEVQINPFTDETEELKGVQFVFEDMRQFRISDFPAEVQTYVESSGTAEKWWFDFASWEDAEAKLGFDMPENTMLSASKKSVENLAELVYEEQTYRVLGQAHCYGYVMEDRNEFWTSAFYAPEEWDPVVIEVRTRLSLGDTTQTAVVRGMYASDDVTVEEYTAKSGVTFTIGYPNYGVGSLGHAVYYQTQFAVDGVLYVIRADSMGGGDMDHQALEALKAVLDGFVF